MSLVRRFDFDANCLYGSILAKSDQVRAIDDFVRGGGHSVDYLLYHPPSMPLSIAYPVASRQILDRTPPLGCRVVPVATMKTVLAGIARNKSPSSKQIDTHVKDAGWRVEYWAADLLLRCSVGRQYDSTSEHAILPIIERRSGPIGAAIAVSIELPSD